MTAKDIILLKARVNEETSNMQNLLIELRKKYLLKNEGSELVSAS